MVDRIRAFIKSFRTNSIKSSEHEHIRDFSLIIQRYRYFVNKEAKKNGCEKVAYGKIL